MHLVRLVQLGDTGDAGQQKRHERRVVLLGKVAEHVAEVGRVDRPEVRRRLHAGQQNGRTAGLGCLNDLGEVGLHLVHRQAAQPIVRPQRQHQHPDIALERPFQAAQSAGRGAAGFAGVDNLERVASLVQHRLEPGRKRQVGRQPEASRQAVTEDDDSWSLRRARGRGVGRQYRTPGGWVVGAHARRPPPFAPPAPQADSATTTHSASSAHTRRPTI